MSYVECESLKQMAKRVDGDVLIVIHWPSRQLLHVSKKDVREAKYPVDKIEYVFRGSY